MISIPSDKPEVFELLAAMCLDSKIEYGPCKRKASTSVQQVDVGGREVAVSDVESVSSGHDSDAVASDHDTREPIVFTVEYHRVSGEGRFVQPFITRATPEPTPEPTEQNPKLVYQLRRQVLKPDTTIDCDTPY